MSPAVFAIYVTVRSSSITDVPKIFEGESLRGKSK